MFQTSAVWCGVASSGVAWRGVAQRKERAREQVSPPELLAYVPCGEWRGLRGAKGAEGGGGDAQRRRERRREVGPPLRCTVQHRSRLQAPGSRPRPPQPMPVTGSNDSMNWRTVRRIAPVERTPNDQNTGAAKAMKIAATDKVLCSYLLVIVSSMLV